LSQNLKLRCSYYVKAPQKKLGRKIKKKITLCRVLGLTLGKEDFAECRPTWHSAKAVGLADPNPASWPSFAECLALGKGGSFAECLTAGHSAKGTTTDAVCPGHPLPSAALCRVPGTRQRSPLPSAYLCREADTRQRDICRVRGLALGKVTASRSETLILDMVTECVAVNCANSERRVSTCEAVLSHLVATNTHVPCLLGKDACCLSR